MDFNYNQQAFFALVCSGLWEKDAKLSQYGSIDFNEIFRLSEEQSVVGLVAAGIEHVDDVKIPQEVALQFAAQTLQLEQRNLLMNGFVAELIESLRRGGIYCLLVKGQGIAQCYERPLWRACGDVDLLLSSDNYNKTKTYLVPLANSVDEEKPYDLHLALSIDSWEVELHGTIRSGLWRRLDSTLDAVQNSLFYEGKVRSWMNDSIQVFLPNQDEDVLIVFSHILQHFFRGGVGLRQICDWCRLLWKYKDSINNLLLETRIKNAGIMSEWRTFAALSVDFLGMPSEAIPYYDSSPHWSKKASKAMRYILSVGNFGHNRDNSFYQDQSYFKRKIKAVLRRFEEFIIHFKIFPIDAIRVLIVLLARGCKTALKGK